jgi:hypothetical protein
MDVGRKTRVVKLQFHFSNGNAMEAVPTPHLLSDDPVAELLAANENNGIEINSKTIVPDWWGHP